jgi:hypothetical protein
MMESRLVTKEKEIPGGKLYEIEFHFSCLNENFRDNITEMIVAAMGGATLDESEEKKPTMGFRQEEDEGE